jgi:hypothetical protein
MPIVNFRQHAAPVSQRRPASPNTSITGDSIRLRARTACNWLRNRVRDRTKLKRRPIRRRNARVASSGA